MVHFDLKKAKSEKERYLGSSATLLPCYNLRAFQVRHGGEHRFQLILELK